MRRFLFCLIFLLATISQRSFAANSPQEPPSIPGFLILHSNKSLSDTDAHALVQVAGGANANMVYLTTLNDAELPDTKKTLNDFKTHGAKSVTFANVSRANINDAAFVSHLKEATGVCIAAAPGDEHLAFFAGSAVEKELRALVARGGAIAAPPVWMSTFIPNAIVETQSATNDHSALLKRVASKPESVGFFFDDNATLFIHLRNMSVAHGKIAIRIAPSADRPARDETLSTGAHWDLVALSRAAHERTKPAFPPAKCEVADIEGGTLVIDGGGIPKDVLPRFIQAAGGPDALILAVPTAQSDDPPMDPSEAKMLRKAGAKNVKTFHLSKYADAFDAEKIKIINEAKGIWFCGGRQWRYVDAYLDTPAEKTMHDLLKRGGAIGGSSAGATIQGDYLVRGNPLGNTDMMAEGYERGLAFLKGVAIDQHFIFRNRFADMTAVKKAFPQLLGLGIDQGAAVVVTGHIFEVIGDKSVCVYDKKTAPTDGTPDYIKLNPGDKYDLMALKKIEVPTGPAKP